MYDSLVVAYSIYILTGDELSVYEHAPTIAAAYIAPIALFINRWGYPWVIPTYLPRNQNC